ncbi:hypothetical protein CBS63078_8472 [Aspergillus niger]|uniref:Contig An05c0050, genomic contig n=7 Tax=Aspergillus TaxID=5052 RepID=A2QKU2_ASPNC|nr:uncharacterized protein An05g01400 [Aspergillus niger]XP_026629065.1 hypothetical protein BDQ94DRAFT_168353 [Aspergillus welwitschiae]EHA25701.1 hypothetical protein ASPNIDRAFT_43884 [Aspergillus niger ATCC 1015]RDH16531.1 hypothetical protein M747DRAFT_334385 [Aspergillus niger ATCC 13496]RDK42273.1 hypothetical protein M752DRAFT_14904 [Aspergillus phoenicis ATCC 13157]KAI2849996.1 hypothetical protein CBS11350_1909 [Aspergillus niger]KAI2854657.1 hypothetical protein CBS12448_7629 [Asper|eukprot:XP_001390715.1 hypothetical protein ANI_1_476044 [Aspergillus niger CBS 513.88]
MSTSTPIPISLNHPPDLQTRDDIIDALYRAVLGFDTTDTRLFDSALFPDSTFDLFGNVMKGLPAIHTECFDKISKLDTTHFLSNIRVSMVEGDPNKAKVTASTLAQHYRPGEGNVDDTSRLLGGAFYYCDVERDVAGDGLWKLRNWVIKLIWTEGDKGVMKGDG